MGFRIFFNSSSCDLGAVLGALEKIGNVIYTNGDLYIWLNEGKGKRTIASTLKKLGIAEFFLQEITEETVSREAGFVYAWCREHLNDKVVAEFEQQHQQELFQMQADITKAEQLLEARERQAKMLASRQQQSKNSVGG